jgi:pimeloyl-ACP methyl ester carboxylesterase
MSSLSSTRAGDGPPLVPVHGLGGRRSSWDPVLPGIAAVREVVTVDLPGHRHDTAARRHGDARPASSAARRPAGSSWAGAAGTA